MNPEEPKMQLVNIQSALNKVYTINLDTVDWNEFDKRNNELVNIDVGLSNMLSDIMHTSPSAENHDELCNNILTSVTEWLDDFAGIKVDTNDVELSLRDKTIVYCYDAISIIRTVIKYLEQHRLIKQYGFINIRDDVLNANVEVNEAPSDEEENDEEVVEDKPENDIHFYQVEIDNVGEPAVYCIDGLRDYYMENDKVDTIEKTIRNGRNISIGYVLAYDEKEAIICTKGMINNESN